MTDPSNILCVVPSRLGVGEEFSLKIKVIGRPREIPSSGNWKDVKPGLGSPFNLNVQRQIQFMDNCLSEWTGKLVVESDDALEGPEELIFDGESQGVYPRDDRPIKVFSGFKWTKPGFHFLKLTDPTSGISSYANPVRVTEHPPRERIFWGDPHWQTFFSDGIRCPEGLYAFARDEAFLDFGAISDHMEAVTDRQWEYFQAVTDDYNEPETFVTLHGQEWTHHIKENGAPGHRNIYFKKSGAPALRCTDKRCNTLEKLWATLDNLEGYDPIAIPHHTANKVMGIDWDQGWNPQYEKAVEIYSVWGSSEKAADDGNTRPIRACNGEKNGRHIVDALNRGYRFGFVGGGDIHDGRPGDDMHRESYPPREFEPYPQGFTAVMTPRLTRGNVHDAIKNHRTYATTKSRIYLDVSTHRNDRKTVLTIEAASEDGLQSATVVLNGQDIAEVGSNHDHRIVKGKWTTDQLKPNDYCYVRITTDKGDIAWSSPVYGCAG